MITMEQYIPKSAIVAKLKRRRKEWSSGNSTEAKYKSEECNDILQLIEELQVTESTKTQHVKETCKENGNSLTQKSETIDFEQELYKYFGQVKDFTLGMRIAKRFYEIGRNHQEPISEDMWEASKQYALRQVLASTDEEMSEDAYLGLRLFSGFELAVAHKDGAIWQKEQMMAKAVDAVVKIDAGGYPYVDRTIELYDYNKDIPLAKRGDKVKVIVIKED